MTTDHLCPLPSPSHQNTVSDTHLSEPIGSVVARLPWVRDAVVPSPAPAPTPSTVLASTLPLAESPLAVLFTAFGHDAACLAAARSGQSFGCHCEGKRSDTGASSSVAAYSAQEGGCKSFAALEAHDDEAAARYANGDIVANGTIDPSLVAGLALRYGHMLKGRGLFLPRGLGLALADLVGTGDPTAQIIWEWCLEHKLIGGDGGASGGLGSELKAKPEPEPVPAPPPPSPILRLVTSAAVRP
ncbi:hypothetical protein NGM99_18300 [Mesorhizobium sp. RP14(2022)]|uniref:Uncharacterized protein n=1 Tax=Mesorhizobium liriopis TaxID=2953882 RepID=A0ABT1CCS5_9HYPH|nr:hypothetical protein [Mesorhizobium liriopis]MCO6051741.1 hypothetical protein [Mesorhizobium liriopis]